MGDHESRPYDLMRLFPVGATLTSALCGHYAFFDTLLLTAVDVVPPVRVECLRCY